MKQCPVCKTTYTDETLRFCLADGGTLFSLPDAEEATVISHNRNPMQINVPPNSASNNFVSNTNQTSAKSRSFLPFIIAGLLFLLLLVAGGVAAIILFNPFGKTPESAVVSNNNGNAKPNFVNNSITNSTPDNQNKEMQEKLANLEKQLQEQKNQKKTVSTPAFPSPPTTPQNDPGRPTARVAQTSDGFLSLRTEPSVKTGTQLVKIPSGATVNLENCEKTQIVIDGRRGRWCMVTYNNQTGWVYDAFLNY